MPEVLQARLKTVSPVQVCCIYAKKSGVLLWFITL